MKSSNGFGECRHISFLTSDAFDLWLDVKQKLVQSGQ